MEQQPYRTIRQNLTRSGASWGDDGAWGWWLLAQEGARWQRKVRVTPPGALPCVPKMARNGLFARCLHHTRAGARRQGDRCGQVRTGGASGGRDIWRAPHGAWSYIARDGAAGGMRQWCSRATDAAQTMRTMSQITARTPNTQVEACTVCMTEVGSVPKVKQAYAKPLTMQPAFWSVLMK